MNDQLKLEIGVGTTEVNWLWSEQKKTYIKLNTHSFLLIKKCKRYLTSSYQQVTTQTNHKIRLEEIDWALHESTTERSKKNMPLAQHDIESNAIIYAIHIIRFVANNHGTIQLAHTQQQSSSWFIYIFLLAYAQTIKKCILEYSTMAHIRAKVINGNRSIYACRKVFEPTENRNWTEFKKINHKVQNEDKI